MALPLRHRYEVLPVSKAERERGTSERWKVTQDGELLTRTRLKRDAVAFAVSIAKGRWLNIKQHATLKIKGRNGKIQDERTYGADPTATKG